MAIRTLMGNLVVMLSLSGVSPFVLAEGQQENLITVRAERTVLVDLKQIDQTLFAVGEQGVIMRSVDQGKNWEQLYTPANRALVSIAKVEKQTLLAAGHGSTMLRSTDNGANWQTIEIDDAGGDSFLGLTVLKNGRVLAYGAYGLYCISDDKGLTWTRQSTFSDEFEWHISEIIQAGRVLYLVGEAGTIGTSHDGGETWALQESPYGASLFGIESLGGKTLLIYGMRGNVFRSNDGGHHWKKIEMDGNSGINAGWVGENGQIVLAGNRGLIAVSNDNGHTFTRVELDSASSIGGALYDRDGALIYVGNMAAGRIVQPVLLPHPTVDEAS